MALIDQLGRDHRNMRILLDLIEREMDIYRSGARPDFDLLRQILEYTLHYPDLVHHPKEDLLFDRLKTHDAAAVAAIGDLISEHKVLGDLTRRFAAAVSNAARDIDVPRPWFEALADSYLRHHRIHMQAEEKHFFPRVLAVLEDSEWAELDRRAAETADPLFGPKVANAYLGLYEQIVRKGALISTT